MFTPFSQAFSMYTPLKLVRFERKWNYIQRLLIIQSAHMHLPPFTIWFLFFFNGIILISELWNLLEFKALGNGALISNESRPISIKCHIWLVGFVHHEFLHLAKPQLELNSFCSINSFSHIYWEEWKKWKV
jgi:hypothetical protein